MDTKTIIVTIVCAVLGSSALTAVVNAVVGAIQKKRGKATTQEAHLAEIDKKARENAGASGRAVSGDPTSDHHVEGVPPFTVADNDKVLGIVNGALAWVTKA